MPIPRPLSIQNKDDIQGRINDSQNKAINALLDNPLNQPLILQNVSLTSGDNNIPHGLGRRLIGWYTTRIRNTAVTFYDKQDSNPHQELTLFINASANVVADIVVF